MASSSSIASSRFIVNDGATAAFRNNSFVGRNLRISSGSDLPRKASLIRRCIPSADLPIDEKETKLGIDGTNPSEAQSFLAEVASIVKLVDSKDIIEFVLKHNGYELTLKKQEALNIQAMEKAAGNFPPAMYPQMQAPYYPPNIPQAPSPAPAAESTPVQVSSVPESSPAAHEYPPFLSPMAGTLYLKPGPSEPPFIKVGDKVKKGQTLCIIEAMKLMNNIECDHDGTVVDILVDDATPISCDTPLFVIKP